MYQAQSGYYYDSTNSYLCGHRFYDPSLCRWINRDPAGYAGGDNLYAYCGGNPVGRSDPSGLQMVDWTPALLPLGMARAGYSDSEISQVQSA
jgi:RHS repeat-associated protein